MLKTVMKNNLLFSDNVMILISNIIVFKNLHKLVEMDNVIYCNHDIIG